MPGRDGTGPMGYGPMTGGRRGFCGAAPYPGRGAGRGRRNQFYATGLIGWQRVAQAGAQGAAPMGDALDPFAHAEEKLAQVFERLDRLESATRD